MVIRKSDMALETRTNMRDGKGTVTIRNLVDKSAMKSCRLMSEIIMPAGSSIGEHEHGSETEYYIITEGSGIVCDAGEDIRVDAGDVVVTGDGASHSIRNDGKAPLKMYAVIITY